MTAVKVHHVAAGSQTGDVIVLSGSLGSDVRMWEPQLAPLIEAGYRVIRYDHRGHGASPVPEGAYTLDDLAADALALVDQLGVDRVHWVGLSLGGMVGQWLGVHRPDRIASLSLLCTSAQLGPAAMWAERARLVRERGTGAVASVVVERWFTPEWRAAHPDGARFYEEMVAATAAEGYASCCAAIEHLDLLGALPRIDAPTLVVSGADDPATPPEHGQRIASAVPGARQEIVDRAAHLGSAEQPDRFTELIISHLKGIP